jgi:hypothetical protein
MMLIEAVRKIQAAGLQVLLEAAPGTSYGGCGDSNLRAYAWSDQNGYECYITVPIGVYDHLDDDEVATMDNVLAAAVNAAA